MRQTMRRMLALLCVMAVFLGLTACRTPDSMQENQPALQKQPDTQPTETEAPETKPTDPAPTDPKPTQPEQTEPIVTNPAPTEPEPTEPKPTTPPEEIEKMQQLFGFGSGIEFYNDALTSDYATPADVNLMWLFYDGFREESRVATDAEAAFLDANVGEYWIYMDLDRLPAKKMDAVLMELFGITLEQTNRVGLESYPYFEETDCYYHCHSGTHYADITITRVENCDDGTVRMYYERPGFPTMNMVATLEPNGDGYRILSNLPESIASDDPEVAQMQLLFDPQYGDPFYNRALRSEYTTPADVDLYDLFYDGFEYEYRKPTNEELTLLEGKLHEYWKQVDLIRLPTSKMDEVLTEMFGLTLGQTNKVRLDEMAYLEETDCYYQAHYGDNLLDIAVQKVVHQADGTILVYYERTAYRDVWVVQMKLSGGKYQILSNLSEVEYMEPEKSAAWKIADQKIQLYELYKYIGIACEFEHVGYEDMSRFLTEEQKKDYYDYQYLILCCHTPEEVRAHIDQLVSQDENLGYPDKRLFTDDQGNLYVTILPTGHSGYRCTKILGYSQERIVATSEFWAYGDSDVPKYLVTFTLDNIDGNFVITSIETEDWQED